MEMHSDDAESEGGDSHYAETHPARHFPETVEIWCPELDEAKVVLGRHFLRHCPMCGNSIRIEVYNGQ